MNLTQAHVAVVALTVICTTALGLAHVLEHSDLQTIYLACLSSLTGHAIGHAAGEAHARGSG